MVLSRKIRHMPFPAKGLENSDSMHVTPLESSHQLPERSRLQLAASVTAQAMERRAKSIKKGKQLLNQR